MSESTFQFGTDRRLTSGAEFVRAFKNPERQVIHAKYIRIHLCQNECRHSRLGITVAKRVVRRAVHRNRIKRQIRESFRTRQNELPPMDFVVVACAGIQGLSMPSLREVLQRSWQKAAELGARDG